MFKYKTQIRLHDTDAAGLLFFANQLVLVHDAYEKLLQKIGFSFEAMLKKRGYFLPIVHIESDYKAPLFVGDEITISVKVANIGTSSFTFVYEIRNKRGILVGTAKTVHVTIRKATKKKITLPKDFRAALERISGQS
jgi:1,4-dihydroxy-2-naphthoyl-CoA hydrolase